MILTYATADSIAGRWELPNHDADMKLGFFDVDAWVVAAQRTTFAGLITLRLERDGDGLRCALARFNDGQRSLGGSWSTDYQGPCSGSQPHARARSPDRSDVCGLSGAGQQAPRRETRTALWSAGDRSACSPGWGAAGVR
jgi:hypothetical protein